VTSFNRLVGIRANLKKSVYVSINSTDKTPLPISDTTIPHASPRSRQRLLGAFFSQSLGTRESARYAKEKIKDLCHSLKGKTISPIRLKYLLNCVVIPSAGYQFSFCPSTVSSLRRMSTIIS
jgi:hypothetical protein